MSQPHVRALIVDDSLSVRTILRRMLSQHPHIEVVGMALARIPLAVLKLMSRGTRSAIAAAAR